MDALLTITELQKTYRGGVRANDGVTLSAEAGQVYGVLGHNGAGKTTLVNQIVGLIKPDAGSIVIDGRDVVADPGFARRVCSIEPQSQVPINGMTPRQAISLVGRLRGRSSHDVVRRSTDLIDALEIGEWADTDGARLSGGVKRLVSFCMAAVVPGRVVMLDEPTNDVDPVRRRHLWAQVRALADGGAAVLLVTHNVIEAERSVDRLGILDRGRVIVEGTPAELKDGFGDDLSIELVLEPGSGEPLAVPFLRGTTRVGQRIAGRVRSADAGEAAAWAQGLQAAGQLEEFSLSPATLEDAYIAIVHRAAAERAAAAGVVASTEVADVSPA